MPRLSDFFQLSASRAELVRLNNINAMRLSRVERMENGKALRRSVPRSSHEEFRRVRGRPDPVLVLEAQNATRIKELVPVRMARMLTSPFAFLRGSAAIMAGDLANSPRTSLEVMACGDMHLMNFGLFASAERNLIFAINDFDEVLPGPWEWDLKRLGASGGRGLCQKASRLCRDGISGGVVRPDRRENDPRGDPGAATKAGSGHLR